MRDRQPFPVFLPGESPWMEEPGRLQSRGRKESDTAERLHFHYSSCVDITQSCPTLCNPMDYTVHGILQARILEWVALPSPGYFPYPGIEPRSLTLQADSLPAEPPGKYFSMSYIFDPICILYGANKPVSTL